MQKFWNWIHDEGGGRVLRLEGPIDSEDVWGDSITPQAFREELYGEEGDVTLWLNSPGGNVFAAAEIYTMLRDYPGSVTVRIASVAASAASVVAMAGDLVQISPTGMLMVHDPSTIAVGNARDMEKAIATLNEVKEGIINAYAYKTGLSRNRISKLMSEETWLNARRAVELGFADEILFEGKKPGEGPDNDPEDPDKEPEGPEEGPEDPEGPDEGGGDGKKPIRLSEPMWQFSSRLMGETILCRLGVPLVPAKGNPEPPMAGTTPAPGTSPEDTPPTDTLPVADTTSVADTLPEADTPPIIGMDGKTKDGAMPYEILKDRLECLR